MQLYAYILYNIFEKIAIHRLLKFPKILFPTEQTITYSPLHHLIVIVIVIPLNTILLNLKPTTEYRNNGSDLASKRATNKNTHSTSNHASFLLHPNHVYLHEVLHTLQQHAVHCASAMCF